MGISSGTREKHIFAPIELFKFNKIEAYIESILKRIFWNKSNQIKLERKWVLHEESVSREKNDWICEKSGWCVCVCVCVPNVLRIEHMLFFFPISHSNLIRARKCLPNSWRFEGEIFRHTKRKVNGMELYSNWNEWSINMRIGSWIYFYACLISNGTLFAPLCYICVTTHPISIVFPLAILLSICFFATRCTQRLLSMIVKQKNSFSLSSMRHTSGCNLRALSQISVSSVESYPRKNSHEYIVLASAPVYICEQKSFH